MLNRTTLVASLALLLGSNIALAGGASGTPAESTDPADRLDQPVRARLSGARRAEAKEGAAGPAIPSGPTIRPDAGDLEVIPPAPTFCFADINLSGAVDWVDMIDYLNMYFAGHVAADFAGNGEVDESDLFKFLDAWLSGC